MSISVEVQAHWPCDLFNLSTHPLDDILLMRIDWFGLEFGALATFETTHIDISNEKHLKSGKSNDT